MTIASTANRNDYNGNDAAFVYAYTYRIFLTSDLLVTVREVGTGVETTLVNNTDYTVSGAGASSGGNVTLNNLSQAWLNSDGTLNSGYDLTIRRVRPVTQTTDIRNQGDFFPEVHEDTFDHLIMVAQQQQDEIDRSVKLAETVSASGFDASLPANIATNPGAAIIVNSAGNGFSLSVSGSDVTRIFNRTSYANLKALAAGAPSVDRWGWATDIKQLVYYTTDLTVGDSGWIIVGG